MHFSPAAGERADQCFRIQSADISPVVAECQAQGHFSCGRNTSFIRRRSVSCWISCRNHENYDFRIAHTGNTKKVKKRSGLATAAPGYCYMKFQELYRKANEVGRGMWVLLHTAVAGVSCCIGLLSLCCPFLLQIYPSAVSKKVQPALCLLYCRYTACISKNFCTFSINSFSQSR